MLIRNVTRNDIMAALAKTNEKFVGNIIIKALAPAGHTRTGWEKWRVQLGVHSAKRAKDPLVDTPFGVFRLAAPGARIRAGWGQSREHHRLAAACWHVFGTFFDALPPRAEIFVSGEKGIHHPGDEWQDRNIGCVAEPMLYSEACDCDVYDEMPEERRL